MCPQHPKLLEEEMSKIHIYKMSRPAKA